VPRIPKSIAGALAFALTVSVCACQAPPAAAPALAAPAPPAATQAPGRVVLNARSAAALFGPASGVQSILDVAAPLHYGEFVWNDRGVAQGPVWVRVDLSRQLVSVFRGGHEIGTAVILYGGNGKPTPTGEFPVLQKSADYHSATYDAPMPYMLRLTRDGVAIHASNVRQGWATHGCVGVPREFARLLFGQVKLGDKVEIVGEAPRA
jgi:hypothetical protein